MSEPTRHFIEPITTANEITNLRIIPQLSAEIGFNESIMLLQIEYWLRKTKHCFDGKYWIYKSVRTMRRDWFPFWSIQTINRIIEKLLTDGYLAEGNYNERAYDQTRWFTLNPEKLKTLKSIAFFEATLIEGGVSKCDRVSQNETGVSQNETTIPKNTTKEDKEKPLSPATQDDSAVTLPMSVNSTQEPTVTDDTVTPAKVKPAKKTCRLLKRDVASQLVPVLFKYGKGRTLESFSQSEVTTIMRNQFTPLLKALQPLDDEHPIDAMELDAAFRWFRKQYKDASYPCGAKTVATMLVNYRAYKRSLQVPKAHLVTPAIDGLLAQPAPRYADSIDIEDVRIIGETK